FVPPNQWLLPPLEPESPSPSSSTPKLVSLFSFNPSLRFSNAGSSIPPLLRVRVRKQMSNKGQHNHGHN
ncbi:hypothetical protein PIB30_106028, partial [Stylosanthes scabra]|nr:hypothetical protein [Stylosanthes scabra]